MIHRLRNANLDQAHKHTHKRIVTSYPLIIWWCNFRAQPAHVATYLTKKTSALIVWNIRVWNFPSKKSTDFTVMSYVSLSQLNEIRWLCLSMVQSPRFIGNKLSEVTAAESWLVAFRPLIVAGWLSSMFFLDDIMLSIFPSVPALWTHHSSSVLLLSPCIMYFNVSVKAAPTPIFHFIKIKSSALPNIHFFLVDIKTAHYPTVPSGH